MPLRKCKNKFNRPVEFPVSVEIAKADCNFFSTKTFILWKLLTNRSLNSWTIRGYFGQITSIYYLIRHAANYDNIYFFNKPCLLKMKVNSYIFFHRKRWTFLLLVSLSSILLLYPLFLYSPISSLWLIQYSLAL